MHKLIQIDLTNANISAFEDYEKQVIPLLHQYGARMVSGVRSVDRKAEIHILYFPDTASFERFLQDPVRAKLQNDWLGIGAVTTVTDVQPVPYIIE
jgi:uncharacterized protein (DUF1330 family)